ncbi:hypothetical protein L208DRAFT_1411566, partial [Tricholoma matsutake]
MFYLFFFFFFLFYSFLFYLSHVTRSAAVLEASGITIAPPEHTKATSSTPTALPSLLKPCQRGNGGLSIQQKHDQEIHGGD